MKFKNTLKSRFPRVSAIWVATRYLAINSESFLHSTNWLKSTSLGTPIDTEGLPIPWMNYAVVAVLKDRLSTSDAVFEWGSGSSTAFWARNSASVHSIEHSCAWYERIRNDLPINATIEHIELDGSTRYENALSRTGKTFDLIVVDGRRRMECFKTALAEISEGSVIALDDSQRERYKESFTLALGQGLSYLNIGGFSPMSAEYEQTTLFYDRLRNNFGI